MLGFTVKLRLRSRIFQRVSGGLKTCWRRSRRGSSLARGEWRKQIQKVRRASSEKLQERLARLPSNQIDPIVQDFEFMKQGWCEETVAKYSFWDQLPHHMLGMWPFDSLSQPMAKRCLELWEGLQAAGQRERIDRHSYRMLSPASPSGFSSMVRKLAVEGVMDHECSVVEK